MTAKPPSESAELPERGVRRWQIEKNGEHMLVRGLDTLGVWGHLVRLHVVDVISYMRLRRERDDARQRLEVAEARIAFIEKDRAELEAKYAFAIDQFEQVTKTITTKETK